MPQRIEVPGEGIVEFPDGMSDEAIATAIKSNFSTQPQQQGLAPSNLLSDAERQASLQKTAGQASFNRGLQDVGEGIKQRAMIIGEQFGLDPAKRQAYEQKVNEGRANFESAYGDVGGAGLMRGIGNTAPLAAVPGLPATGLLARIAVGGLQGLGLGATTYGATEEDRDRSMKVGALFGAGIPAIAGAVKGAYNYFTGNTVQDMAREALSRTTPQQFAKAEALQEASQGVSPITGAEALGNKRLLSTQLNVEQSRKGGPIMEEFMSKRPAQVEQAANQEINKIGPRIADPYTIGTRVNNAANEAINEARKAGNAKAEPIYESIVTEKNRVNSRDFSKLAQDPVINRAISEVIKDPLWGISKTASPASMVVLDSAKRHLDDQIGAALRAGENNKARVLGDAKTKLLGITTTAYPKYSEALNIVSKNFQEVVDPMKAGLPGKLAETNGPKAQAKVLLNKDEATPESIAAVAKDLAKSDKTALRDVMRLHVKNALDDAVALTQQGKNEFAGAKFNVILRKTPQAAANLEAALKALPDGQARVDGMRRLLDVFEAQGRRYQVGSRTAFNEAEKAEMTHGKLSAATRPIKALGDFYDRLRAGKNSEEWANLLTHPESVRLLRELATVPANSPQARSIAERLVTQYALQPSTKSDGLPFPAIRELLRK